MARTRSGVSRHEKILSVLLRPEDKERLAEAAQQENRSMSDLAQLMIRAALDAREAAAKRDPEHKASGEAAGRVLVAA